VYALFYIFAVLQICANLGT